MTKDDFKKAMAILKMNAVHFSEWSGFSQSTVRGWRSTGGPTPPPVIHKLLELEFKIRGYEWPIVEEKNGNSLG